MITLEQVDQLRKRTNCSYEEAKELLEKHNGDVLEAIVDFEKNRKGKSYSHQKGYNSFSENTQYRSGSDFWKKVREFIQLGFDCRIVAEDHKGILLNIPVNIMILLVIFLPYVMIPAFILLLVLRYKISIIKPEGTEYNISAVLKDVTDKFAANNQNQPPDKPEYQEIEPPSEKDDYNEIIIE
ncbi:MAG: DUF4342 domain-containing protein [Clostridiaceae bacterium]|nr:DUF4342 domain-containing protein [Clostridiaceae bacterium]